jgi:hypothetical protein
VCGRCGRPLREEQERQLGYGLECVAKMQAAIPTSVKAYQIDKAVDLLADHGLVPLVLTDVPCRIWKCISADGQRRYLTTTRACTCPAGQAERFCYHRLAALMLSA